MKSVKRSWLGPLAIAALLGLTAWTVLRGQSLAQLSQALAGASPRFVGAGLGLMLAFVGCEALSTRTILGQLGAHVPYRRCLGYAFTGFVFSSITPSSSGGQPAQICAMARDGIPAAYAALVMLLNAVCYQTATLGLALWAMAGRGAALGALGGGLGLLLGLGMAVAVCLTLGMLGLLFAPRLAQTLCSRVLALGGRLRLVRDRDAARLRLERHLAAYRQGAACLRKRPALLPCLLGLAGAQLFCLYLVPWVVYRAFALSERGPLELARMQAILTLAVGFLPLPGSAGAAEGAFLRGYAVWFGPALVAPAMVLSRGISFYCFLPLAALAALTARLLARTEQKNRRAKRARLCYTVSIQAWRERRAEGAQGNAQRIDQAGSGDDAPGAGPPQGRAAAPAAGGRQRGPCLWGPEREF
jgi:hypothetical protein